MTIVLSAYNVLNYPEGGGHFWVYMQYVQGLRRLGCDVYWLEKLQGRRNATPDAGKVAEFAKRMERFGMGGKVILYENQANGNGDGARDYIGMSREDAEAILRRADLLLNFHYRIDPELLSLFRRTALVNIDPGILQFWVGAGQLSVPSHDVYFANGEVNVGAKPRRLLHHWRKRCSARRLDRARRSSLAAHFSSGLFGTVAAGALLRWWGIHDRVLVVELRLVNRRKGSFL